MNEKTEVICEYTYLYITLDIRRSLPSTWIPSRHRSTKALPIDGSKIGSWGWYSVPVKYKNRTKVLSYDRWSLGWYKMWGRNSTHLMAIFSFVYVYGKHIYKCVNNSNFKKLMTLHSWHSTANRLNVIYIPGYRATSVPFLTLPLAITTPIPAPGTLLCDRIIQNPRTDSATWYDTKQFQQWVIMSPLVIETEWYRSASAMCSWSYFPGKTMNTINRMKKL